MRRRRRFGIAAGVAATLLCAVSVALIALATPPGAGGRSPGERHGLRVLVSGAWAAPASDMSVVESPVLLVHGLDEPGDVWDDLAPALAEAGHTPIRFDYPNDQPVERSAAALVEALESLRGSGVGRLSIVAHSMGGLVSLDALTRAREPDAIPEVDRLVTLGTPFGGSPWSRLRWAGELREQAQRLAEHGVGGIEDIRRFLDDGRGEAAADLAPGSPLLTDLLARPRPEGVRITCVRGRLIALPAGAPPDLVSLSQGLGDGVVPVASAALPGVEDVVELGANHRAMVRRLPFSGGGGDGRAATPPAIPVILDRLGGTPSGSSGP